MKDLDQLQQDLENLLSTCAVRHKSLKSEFDSLDRSDERKDRKGKPSEKVLPQNLTPTVEVNYLQTRQAPTQFGFRIITWL